MKVDHIGRSPDDFRQNANVGAVEVEAAQVARHRQIGASTYEKKILVQASHTYGQRAASLIRPMWIGNANGEFTHGLAAGVTTQRPGRIPTIQILKNGIQLDSVIYQQDILMTDYDVFTSSDRQEQIQTLICVILIRIRIIYLNKFAIAFIESMIGE